MIKILDTLREVLTSKKLYLLEIDIKMRRL